MADLIDIQDDCYFIKLNNNDWNYLKKLSHERWLKKTGKKCEQDEQNTFTGNCGEFAVEYLCSLALKPYEYKFSYDKNFQGNSYGNDAVMLGKIAEIKTTKRNGRNSSGEIARWVQNISALDKQIKGNFIMCNLIESKQVIIIKRFLKDTVYNKNFKNWTEENMFYPPMLETEKLKYLDKRFESLSVGKQNNYIKEISSSEKTTEEVVSNFLKRISAKVISKEEFIYKNKKVFIDYHPFNHSDDIIIHEDIIDKYDNFLLVKTGASQTRIPGWCSREQLKSTQKRDIYRNGKYYYLVNDTNIKDLSIFELENNKKLKTEFIINKQKADTLAGKEYIDSILAGLHSFAKQAGIFFKDINQKDECILGDKKIKIYTRDIMSDEDMLIYDSYYKVHPEIDIYITCKIKSGNYWYVGYTTKEVVKNTRIVKMIGSENESESSNIRRIFAEQYKPISDLIKIYEDEKEEKIIIPQSYVPLHVHSEFSIGDGFGTINYIAENLYKKGFKGAALTDHGTMAGVWYFQKALLEKGLKPAVGCEFYVKIPETDKRMHIVLIAKTKEGWQNLIKLQSIAIREHFYYKPIIQIDEVLKYSKGVIAMTACMSGIIPSLLSAGKEELAEKYLLDLKNAFGEDLYGEIMLHTIEDNQKIMKQLHDLCGVHGVKCVFTTDSHYPNAEDIKYHEAIKAIGRKTKYGEAGFSDDCFYLMTDEEIKKRIDDNEQIKWLEPIMDELKANTNEVFDKVDFLIEPPNEIDTLPKLFGSQKERKAKLKELCLAGLEKYTPYKYEGKIKEQLDLEMDRVFEKNYENYFLIVYYMIKYAKENDILCGPGRGSVGASLLAYTLNITKCDPIKFNLLFDRFMSEIRRDMPDVDMDFQDSKRHEIFDYLRKEYGENNCAKVATYSRFHPKGILRDIGRIYSIPIKEIEKICSLVIERSGGDARASFGLYDTFEEYQEAKDFKIKYPDATDVAIKLEGHVRHKGIHAAAMVVTEKDINNYVPIGKTSGEIVVEWEKQLAEDMKLIKFDILGLKTLSVISDCIKDSGVEPPSTFDDAEVFEKVFKNGKTLGVFQAETVGMSKLIKQLKTDDFKTLYHATTLFRPSALHSGQTMMYVNRKLGKEDVKYEHPLLEKLTKDTLGTIMFQEQIMQIMHKIGGMSWATAEMARKVITKSKGKKAFEEMRAEFVKNANNLHDMPTKEAEKLYDVVSTFGSYGFNMAHAVEYSIISYWCAYYKTHFPLAFYKAILKYETDAVKISNYLDDAKLNNIEIEYPHINLSGVHYEIKNNKIYSGFDSIKGIGERTAEKIIKFQPYENFENFLSKSGTSKSILKKLIIADCFRDFKINKKVCYSDEIKNIQNYYDEILPDFSELEHAELIMGNTTLKPKIDLINTYDFGEMDFTNISDLGEEYGGQLGYVRGIVTAVINKDKLILQGIRDHIHQFENHMFYLNLNDSTGNLAIQVSPWTYDKYKDIIRDLEGKPIVVYGKFAKSGQKMYAELIELPQETYDITELHKNLKGEVPIIISATPAVSKKGNSYYRLKINDEAEGLCFKSPRRLYAGMLVNYKISQKPFMEIKIR